VQPTFLTNQLRQALAFDVLHHDVVRAGFFAPVVDADDVRVIEICGGLGLTPEAFNERRGGRELGEQDLDRDGTIKQLVACEVHVGHAPSGQPSVQLIPSTEHGGSLFRHLDPSL